VIRRQFGCEPRLIPSGGGVFEVSVDGELVFSKAKAGRFPTEEEVVSILTSRGDS
jgi:selenoprotein W-related protein